MTHYVALRQLGSFKIQGTEVTKKTIFKAIWLKFGTAVKSNNVLI